MKHTAHTHTHFCHNSTPAMVMDGEAFLKQDFEDAVSFKSVLKGTH